MRHRLQAELPEYMVPSAIVKLDMLPVTVNGKLDRRALPVPGTDAYSCRSFEPPVGDTEIAVAEIWAGLLKLDRVGRHDNFFEIGGHSLLAMRMVARVSTFFKKPLTLTLFIQTPTISHVAQLLSGKAVAQVAVVNKGSAGKISLILVAPLPWHPRLTSHLSPEQPVFSFALTQAEIAATAPRYALEDMATSMVQKIRRSYPLSAYALAGFCQVLRCWPTSALSNSSVSAMRYRCWSWEMCFPPAIFKACLSPNDPSGVGNAKLFICQQSDKLTSVCLEESTETATGALGRCGNSGDGRTFIDLVQTIPKP